MNKKLSLALVTLSLFSASSVFALNCPLPQNVSSDSLVYVAYSSQLRNDTTPRILAGTRDLSVPIHDMKGWILHSSNVATSTANIIADKWVIVSKQGDNDIYLSKSIGPNFSYDWSGDKCPEWQACSGAACFPGAIPADAAK